MKVLRQKKGFPIHLNNFDQRIIVLSFTFLLITFGSHINLYAQEKLDTSFNAGVSDARAIGYVSAVQTDGKILVGGTFQIANGTRQAHIARLNADGTIDSSFNPGGSGADSDIYAIVVQPDGKILIGGDFTTFNGAAISGLARLNSDGSLDTSFSTRGSGIRGLVQTIALQMDGKILIAGRGISIVDDTFNLSIFRLNADGTLDTSFRSNFNSPTFIMEIVVQPDSKILVGGFFDNYGGVARNSLVRLNSDGRIDASFVPATPNNSDIHAVTIQPDGKILIGGNFDTVSFARLFIRLNPNGSLDNTFTSSNFRGRFAEDLLVQPDGKILAAGSFDSNSSTEPFYPLIRLNSDGSVDNSFQLNTGNLKGYNVKLQTDGKIILTGLFTRYGGQKRNAIVRVNSDGTIDSSFDASLTDYGTVKTIAIQSDGKILVGGTFQTANGKFSNSVARYNSDGTLDASFNIGTGPGFDILSTNVTVAAIAVQSDGKILVGGNFGSFNGVPRTALARLNADGSVDSSFNAPELSGIFPTVNDIFVQTDGKILVGGQFFLAGVAQFRYLVRLNSDGSLDSTFNSGNNSPMLGTVYKITSQTDGKFIISGDFTEYNKTSRNRIARINADGTLDQTFVSGINANNTIYDAVIQNDGKILVGGAFTDSNNISPNHFARLNADGSLDTTFNVGTGADDIVYSIAVQSSGKIFIGGLFANYNGRPVNRLAKLNADGSLDNNFISGFNDNKGFYVRELLYQTDGKLLVGGKFNSYNGVPRNSLLRLTAAASQHATRFDFDGDSKADVSVFRPSNGVWYLLQSNNGFTGAQFGASSDKIVPADYDGDGKTDIAVYRSGVWYLNRSQLGFTGFAFGDANDIPQPADFDGDGKAELAVFRPSNGTWYVFNLATNSFNAAQFGASTDKPVVGDYDGDGKADYTVFRPSNGTWYLQRSQAGFTGIQFGDAQDKPVAADYDGDGKTDIAVFRPSNGTWYLLRSTQGFTGVQFGIPTDLPTPADYDGDGKADIAVFRSGVWYLQQTTAGFTGVQFGATTDKPVPNAFVP